MRGFQTDAPMIPLMADAIGDLVRNFLRRIILKEVLKKCSSLYNLIQLNPLDKNIRKPPESQTEIRMSKIIHLKVRVQKRNLGIPSAPA